MAQRRDLPSAAQWAERDEHATAEAAFWEAHFEALRGQYPNQWVAVEPLTEAVLAVEPELEPLLHQLDALGQEPTTVWLTFMAADPLPLFL